MPLLPPVTWTDNQGRVVSVLWASGFQVHSIRGTVEHTTYNMGLPAIVVEHKPVTLETMAALQALRFAGEAQEMQGL